MKNPKFKTKMFKLLFCILSLAFSLVCVKAQSTNIEFPTAVTTNEIKGKIPARDVGDARQTSHYYFFNGEQGDIFIKILTSNLDGDIDIFIADTLRPLTKISVYSDNSIETGREVYLRKPEKLLLRVEGRTPTDEAATYSIKFEGSFLAVTQKKGIEEPKSPIVKPEIEKEGIVKVNSVGTIIKTPPKKVIPAKPTVANTTAKSTTVPRSVSTVDNKTETSEKPESEKTEKPDVIVTENLGTDTTPKEPTTTENAEVKPIKSAKKGSAKKKNTTAKPVTTADTDKTVPKAVTDKTATTAKTKTTIPAKPTEAEELTKALENVKLVILLKDGTQIEHPMSEVLRVNVINGILTVTAKNGSIRRYSILNISKMAIE